MPKTSTSRHPVSEFAVDLKGVVDSGGELTLVK